MREKELGEIVTNIIDHPLFINHFYNSKKKRIIPDVTILSEAYGLNAFAVMDEKGQIGIQVTRPLIYLLDSDEFRAVIGHELCHLKYKDGKQGFLSLGIKAGVLLMGCIFLTLYMNPIITFPLFILGAIILRKDYYTKQKELEYRADIYGAAIASPEAMINALHKLDAYFKKAYHQQGDNTNMQKLVNHFETHPFFDERIQFIKDFSKK